MSSKGRNRKWKCGGCLKIFTEAKLKETDYGDLGKEQTCPKCDGDVFPLHDGGWEEAAKINAEAKRAAEDQENFLLCTFGDNE